MDVEDYFQVEAFADRVDRRQWSEYPSRVEKNTLRMLDLVDACGAKGTFFILGWVAERFPQLVREIDRRGHEIGCHSYWHRMIIKLTPEEFREDTQRAKKTIEDAGGVAVRGYRAPTFSVTRKSLWALEILAECGFHYDSSIFPIRHDLYGIPDAPRIPFRVESRSGAVAEFPMTTFRWLRSGNLPVGGGGYLRILPEWMTALGIRRAWQEGLPLIVYVHPWEIDPEQPRLQGRLLSRLRHYRNLEKTAERLRRFLAITRFSGFEGSGLIEPTLEAAAEAPFPISA